MEGDEGSLGREGARLFNVLVTMDISGGVCGLVKVSIVLRELRISFPCPAPPLAVPNPTNFFSPT
jgi:hypothetical protein